MNTTRTVTRRPANHALHLFLTVVTLGLWSPVWIAAAALGRRETVTTYPHAVPPYGGREPQWNPYSGRWQ